MHDIVVMVSFNILVWAADTAVRPPPCSHVQENLSRSSSAYLYSILCSHFMLFDVMESFENVSLQLSKPIYYLGIDIMLSLRQ